MEALVSGDFSALSMYSIGLTFQTGSKIVMAHFNRRERKQNKVGLRFHIRTPVSKLGVRVGEKNDHMAGDLRPLAADSAHGGVSLMLLLVSVPLITRYVMNARNCRPVAPSPAPAARN